MNLRTTWRSAEPVSCRPYGSVLIGLQGFWKRYKRSAAGTRAPTPGAYGLRRYHPPIPSALIMAIELRDADCTQRLANQLQTLSEVAEAITFRLLELEERLAAQELRLEPLLQGHADSQRVPADETELRLDDTEDRLARLEGLLRGIENQGVGRHLRPVASQLAHAQESLQDSFLDDSLAEQPFLDEEEQPFLDELSA